MSSDEELIEVWRGDMIESRHRGHAVICNAQGEVIHAWGTPQTSILPRSSCKMIQAVPLAESGLDLSCEQLALACASHEGAPAHVSRVQNWLSAMGLGEQDLRCGAQPTRDRALRKAQIRAGQSSTQLHNNCSGKHAGFLALTQHMRAGPEYVHADHPVQIACKAAFEEMTRETSPGFAIDGCSAPNHAVSLLGLARGVAQFAGAGARGGKRANAQQRLLEAMLMHPHLVAGEGRACTEIMEILAGRGVAKTGAEGVFVAILPERDMGIALKISDGATRAAEAAMVAILAALGELDPEHPLAQKRLGGAMHNWRGIKVGAMRAAPGLAVHL